MNKIVWTLPFITVVAACSQETADTGQQHYESGTSDASMPDAMHRTAPANLEIASQPPGIKQDVAPGVAFDFRYQFSLPEARIADVQEKHATLCSRLGLSRCRVTGLTFNKARDGNIDAKTVFKLDPALALSFARDATALVEQAEGKLAASQVRGDDLGSAIVEDDKNAAVIQAELRKAEAELKIPGLSKEVRSRLVERQQQLRSQLAALQKTRGEKVENLATTPVVFDYEAGDTVLGMDRSAPFRQGLSTGATSFSAMLGVLALLIGAVAPWALLGVGLWWAFRRFRPVRAASAPEQN